jgi:small subunit ribosomal protein S6
MFLLDPNSYARDPAGMAQRIQGLIENTGGRILASRLWNEQRLAYPIKGQRKGVYWLTYFDLESTDIPKFTRACQLTDQILRFLTIRLDPRLVDPMVAAAKGEAPKAVVASEGVSAEEPELADQEAIET